MQVGQYKRFNNREVITDVWAKPLQINEGAAKLADPASGLVPLVHGKIDALSRVIC